MDEIAREPNRLGITHIGAEEKPTLASFYIKEVGTEPATNEIFEVL